MNRILLAVADRTSSDAYVRCMEQEGFEVCAVFGGVECAEQLINAGVDLLIIDAGLLWGGCDGVLEWLSFQPVGPNLPVILLGEPHNRLQTLELWEYATESLGLMIDRVLFQPVTPRQLLLEAVKVRLSFERFDVRAV